MELKITRAVMINGSPAKAGDTVTVDDKTGKYLVAIGKATIRSGESKETPKTEKKDKE